MPFLLGLWDTLFSEGGIGMFGSFLRGLNDLPSAIAATVRTDGMTQLEMVAFRGRIWVRERE
jgi:hypothetical protein